MGDDTGTHDVITESFVRKRGGTLNPCETAQFGNEEAALSFIDLYTEHAAKAFIERNA
jgi:hypothetical protein